MVGELFRRYFGGGTWPADEGGAPASAPHSDDADGAYDGDAGDAGASAGGGRGGSDTMALGRGEAPSVYL